MNQSLDSNHSDGDVEIYSDLIVGGGEMGKRIREFDWATTGLGTLDQWSASLRAVVNMMLQSSAAINLLLKPEGICIYNDAYAFFAGHKHPVLLGASAKSVWHETEDLTQHILDNGLSGKSISYKQLPYTIYRNGEEETVWMDLDCSPIVNEKGMPYGVMIINVEVTAQVKADQRRQLAEDRFEVAMDAAGMVGTWDWHIEKDIVYSDPRFASFFSVDPKKAIQGAPMSEYLKGIYPEDVGRVDEAMTNAILSNDKYSEEYRLLKPDGTIRWIIAKGQCFYDLQNKPVRFSGVAVDITDRKQMETVLWESRENFSSIFNQTSVGIAQTDLSGKFLLVNDRYCEIVGRGKEQLYQMNLFDITHPDDLDENVFLVDRAIGESNRFKFEKRYVRPDGNVVWVNINVSSVNDAKGKPLYILGVIQNITERKHAERALAFQSRITKKLTDNATVGMFMLDAKGHTTFANPAAEQMTGYTLQEMKGAILHDLVHYSHADGSSFPMEDCTIGRTIFSRGRLNNHEDLFIRKDGSFFPVLCSASVIKENKEIIGVILEVQDISERKLAEHSLIESEERFRILANAAPNFVWSLNPDFSIKYINNYGLKFLGINPEEVINTNWYAYIHPDDLEATKEKAGNAINDKAIYSIEHRILREDGIYRWVLTQGRPSYYPNGSLYAYVGSSVDITEQKQTEKTLELKNAQLLRINNDLDNFIYTASHDLKSPISNIEGLVGALYPALDHTSKSNKDVITIIDMIHTSIDRFKNTIKDLTEVAKVQNNIEEDLSEVFFKEMLEEATMNIKSDIEKSNANITHDFSQAPSIYFSRKNLRSILYNLISNAIKYRSPERPIEINIATAPVKQYVLLTVRDNGLGIKEEDKSKVFTMFKRLHQHVEGTGIGLAIVKKIIDNTGGKIEIESEEDQGALFKVYFRRLPITHDQQI